MYLYFFPRHNSSHQWAPKSVDLHSCSRNATTGRPDLVDQALLFEFSRVDHKADVGIWHPNGSLPYFEQDLATFMLVRGAHAWMGYTWSGPGNIYLREIGSKLYNISSYSSKVLTVKAINVAAGDSVARQIQTRHEGICV